MRCLGLLLLSSVAYAHTITLSTESEDFLFDVRPDQSIEEVVEYAAPFLEERDSFILEVSKKGDAFKFYERLMRSQGQYLGYPRNYEAGVTHVERGDIQYIVLTLANKSLLSIAKAKGDLEEAGDRIDHIHPLQFLRTVFTDEEMKVGIRNIRGKGWVWHSFSGGIKDTLSTEAKVGNLKDEYVEDFAGSVGLKPAVLQSIFESQNWDNLIDYLISNIPRKGNGNRYDC